MPTPAAASSIAPLSAIRRTALSSANGTSTFGSRARSGSVARSEASPIGISTPILQRSISVRMSAERRPGPRADRSPSPRRVHSATHRPANAVATSRRRRDSLRRRVIARRRARTVGRRQLRAPPDVPSREYPAHAKPEARRGDGRGHIQARHRVWRARLDDPAAVNAERSLVTRRCRRPLHRHRLQTVRIREHGQHTLVALAQPC